MVIDRLRGAWSTEAFWAVRDVSFTVRAGEIAGIIGPNGSGKSTILKLIANILYPTAGQISIRGSVSAMLELGAGFDPEFTGRENVFLVGSFLGLSVQDVRQHYDEIVDFAELGAFIDQPVKHYSSGMYVRLGFSTVMALHPEILLVDEALSVGDEHFKHKCEKKLSELRDSGATIILVTHSMPVVRKLCSKAMWIDHGQCLFEGSAEDVADCYLARVAELEGLTSDALP